MTPPKAKQGLPEWVENGDWTDPRHCERVEEALSIAWEALEYGFNGFTLKAPGMSVQSRPLSKSEIQFSLKEAMRQIEELK